jgi:N-acetylglucosaminyldiphosphoundecaprenol N-acetyl-beta-D-mannosaminyltransferase
VNDFAKAWRPDLIAGEKVVSLSPKPAAPAIRIVGSPVSLVTMDRVLEIFDSWIGSGRDRIVLLRDVHGAMKARRERDVAIAQENADLVLPDGMPFVWMARLAGKSPISRVCGIDLLPAACRFGVDQKWRHFFYGSSPAVLETLSKRLNELYPGIEIVGTLSPPFRPLTPAEHAEHTAQIRAAKPDFVWVSLSTPKQDLWMNEHNGKLGGVTMVGVGAAFDINAGDIPRAPVWMQKNALEWVYRLACEPRRLWKRYAVTIPAFVVLGTQELLWRRLGFEPRAKRPLA